MARYLFLREELPIFVGYGQLNKYLSTKLFVGYGQVNYTTILLFRFFAPDMYCSSYLNMQHLGTGPIFSF